MQKKFDELLSYGLINVGPANIQQTILSNAINISPTSTKECKLIINSFCQGRGETAPKSIKRESKTKGRCQWYLRSTICRTFFAEYPDGTDKVWDIYSSAENGELVAITENEINFFLFRTDPPEIFNNWAFEINIDNGIISFSFAKKSRANYNYHFPESDEKLAFFGAVGFNLMEGCYEPLGVKANSTWNEQVKLAINSASLLMACGLTQIFQVNQKIVSLDPKKTYNSYQDVLSEM